MTDKLKRIISIGFIGFGVLVMALVVGMNIKSGVDSRGLLESSIKSQLISIAAAAREMIDVDAFAGYNAKEDISGSSAYQKMVSRLRMLSTNVGAQSIYAIKKQGNDAVFVFSTDQEHDLPFTKSTLDPVHEDAFSGRMSAGVRNASDAFGSYNTSAVPILTNGEVIGIVGVDILDVYVAENDHSFVVNNVLLVSVLAALIAVVGVILMKLMSRVKKMQDELDKMAYYDKLTELPNRRFLLDHLASLTTHKSKPFAMFFIDMDKFKKVNDNAGHDAGDALLQHVGAYLQGAADSSQVFRPGPGSLNVAARIGGDEFVLIVPELMDELSASAFAAELVSGLRREVADRYIEKYEVGLSIGVALYPLHSENFHVLIKYADTAMYEAKRVGKNQYRIYEDGMSRHNNLDSNT